MKRSLTPRKGSGGDDVPDFVRVSQPGESAPPVPRCVRCGGEVPRALELHTLCEGCIQREFAVTATMDRQSAIAALRDRLATTSPKPGEQQYNVNATEPVQHHAKHLMDRGLSETAAYTQAQAMVESTEHTAECEVCRQHPEPGQHLRSQREVITKLSRKGMEAIGPVLNRLVQQHVRDARPKRQPTHDAQD